MKYFPAMLGLFIILFSCTEKELNTTVNIAELSDLVLKPATYRTDKYDHFNAEVVINQTKDTLRFCECSQLINKITILIHDGGGMNYNEIKIEITNHVFISSFAHTADVISLEYKANPIQQTLKLNRLNPKQGESLTGEVKFKGIFINGYLQNPLGNVDISGKFTCKVIKESN
ncbi:MAG: hypothetical protein AAFO69_00265 [Bacteroidota bacterium]